MWISLEGHRILLHREQTAVHSHNHQSESFLLLFAFCKQLHMESEFVVQLYQTSLVIYLLVLRITFFLRKPKAKIIPRYLVRRIWFTISFIVHCFFFGLSFHSWKFWGIKQLVNAWKYTYFSTGDSGLNIQLSQFANFTKTKMVSCFRLSFQQVEYCFLVNLGS